MKDEPQIIEHSYNREKLRIYEGEVPTLRSQSGGGGYTAPSVILKVGTLRTHKDGEGFREMQSGVAPSLNARARQDGSQQPIIEAGSNIRRLTPIECERLQGFPDNWTRYGIDEKGKSFELSDSARYRLCGNAVTTFVVEAQIKRMIEKGCLG